MIALAILAAAAAVMYALCWASGGPRQGGNTMLIKIGKAYIDPDEVAAIEPWEDESCFCESPYAAFHLRTGAIIVIEKISQEDLDNFILSAALAEL